MPWPIRSACRVRERRERFPGRRLRRRGRRRAVRRRERTQTRRQKSSGGNRASSPPSPIRDHAEAGQRRREFRGLHRAAFAEVARQIDDEVELRVRTSPRVIPRRSRRTPRARPASDERTSTPTARRTARHTRRSGPAHLRRTRAPSARSRRALSARGSRRRTPAKTPENRESGRDRRDRPARWARRQSRRFLALRDGTAAGRRVCRPVRRRSNPAGFPRGGSGGEPSGSRAPTPYRPDSVSSPPTRAALHIAAGAQP